MVTGGEIGCTLKRGCEVLQQCSLAPESTAHREGLVTAESVWMGVEMENMAARGSATLPELFVAR